jgi:hypothetical protein
MPYLDTGRISLFFKDSGSGGIPVLLLHELGGNSESWREVIPLLATDRRVPAEKRLSSGLFEPLTQIRLAQQVNSELRRVGPLSDGQ